MHSKEHCSLDNQIMSCCEASTHASVIVVLKVLYIIYIYRSTIFKTGGQVGRVVRHAAH